MGGGQFDYYISHFGDSSSTPLPTVFSSGKFVDADIPPPSSQSSCNESHFLL
jgi:hypothetical protein